MLGPSMYAGVETVWLLDGGIDAWLEGGREVAPSIKTAWDLNKSQSHRLPRSSGWRLRREYLASAVEVQAIASGLELSTTKLVDIRRRGE